MDKKNVLTKTKDNREIKRKHVIILILSAIILTILILFNLAIWGGNTLTFKVSPSSNLINKVMTLRKTGGELEISSEDVNGVLDAFVTNGAIPKGKDIDIDSILCNMTEDRLVLYVPAKIKNFDVLLQCTGTLCYINENIKFTPNSFKIGKLKLPTALIMEKLSPMLQKMFTIKEGSIIVSKDMLPIDISSMEVKDGKILASIEKLVIEESDPTPKETASNEESVSKNNTSKTDSTTKSSAPTAEEIRQSQLKKTLSDLSRVNNAVETDSGKKIISTIKSVVNKMIVDPNYDHQSAAASVKSKYNALSAEEKSDVKNAILFNMSMESLRNLNNTFHLI